MKTNKPYTYTISEKKYLDSPFVANFTRKNSELVNIWSVDRDFRYTFFNENHARDMKRVWNAKIALGETLTDYITDEKYRKGVEKSYSGILKGDFYHSITKFASEDGTEHFYENFGSPIQDAEKKVIGIMLYAVDVTERINLEEKLHSSTALLKSIVNSPRDVIIYSVDRDFRYIFFNNAHAEAMKEVWGRDPVLGENIFSFLPEGSYRNKRRQFYLQALKGDVSQDVDELKQKDGSVRFFENIIEPIRDNEGAITGLTLFVLEITEKEKAQRELRKSLNEKEMLLKEIHHRIKNNLQLVNSMLTLQQAILSDPDAQQALEDSISRINTMAFIHKYLYQGERYEEINMEKYIQPLIESTLQLFLSADKKIRVDTNMGDISLDLDRAIPVGLIINELITNSLKYAFPDQEEGLIRIGLHKADDSVHYHLQVTDNGKGIDPSVTTTESDSFGMRLISALTSQLNGNVVVRSNQGTIVDIFFS